MSESGERLRLNQAIAKTGLCSRRNADELIAAGRVYVNGVKSKDFNRLVDPAVDELTVDGKPIAVKKYVYIAMNKPAGVVTTTSDERSRQTVIDLLPDSLRHVKPVGRLDMYSEGLLLLTNDGDFTQRLVHPSQHMPKVYWVKVKGQLQNSDLIALQSGIPLEDGFTLPAGVRLVERNKTYTEIEITLIEGRNRQIRRMIDYLGYRVLRLVRLAIGGLQLGQIAPGTWRYLTSQEVSELLSHPAE